MRVLRRLILAGCALALLAVAGAGAIYFWARAELERPRSFPAPVSVELATGTSSRAILERARALAPLAGEHLLLLGETGVGKEWLALVGS